MLAYRDDSSTHESQLISQYPFSFSYNNLYSLHYIYTFKAMESSLTPCACNGIVHLLASYLV
jgi:hypothetical protein